MTTVLPLHSLYVAFASEPDDPFPVWSDISASLDTAQPITTSRGRQSEDDDTQPGTFGCVLDNSDGRFTPNQPASPYYPGVKLRRRVMYGRTLPGGPAGEQLAESQLTTSSLGRWFAGGTEPTLTIQSTFLHAGTASMLIQWATATTDLDGVAIYTARGLHIGQIYTASFWYRVPTGSTDLALFADVADKTLSTKDSLTRAYISWVADAPEVDVIISNAATTGAGEQAVINAFQVERITPPPGYVIPGDHVVDFPPSAYIDDPAAFTWRFSGFADQWATKWVGGPGRYSETRLAATDQLKRLGARGKLRSIVEQEVLLAEPAAYYTLGEPGGATTAADSSGNGLSPAGIAQLGAGGTIAFGDGTGPGNDGLSAAVFTPVDANNGRYLAGRMPPFANFGATVAATINSPTINAQPYAFLLDGAHNWFGIYNKSAGQPTVGYFEAATGTLHEFAAGFSINLNRTRDVVGTLNVTAGAWALALYVDGALVGTATGSTGQQIGVWDRVTIGGRDKTAGLYTGTLANVRVYARELAAGEVSDQWHAGTDVFAGESTVDRALRVLAYRGVTDITYDTQSAAPQLMSAQSTAGRDPLDVLREIERTEGGQLWIAGDGTSTFAGRDRRWNRPADAVLSAASVDPDDLELRGDDAAVVNIYTATRPAGISITDTDTASVADLGEFRGGADIAALTDDQLASSASWGAHAGGVWRPHRISQVTASLTTQPAIRAAVEALDLGARIRIADLPAQAPASTLDLYVEGWVDSYTDAAWSITLNTSPGELYDAWQVGVPGHSETGITTRTVY